MAALTYTQNDLSWNREPENLPGFCMSLYTLREYRRSTSQVCVDVFKWLNKHIISTSFQWSRMTFHPGLVWAEDGVARDFWGSTNSSKSRQEAWKKSEPSPGKELPQTLLQSIRSVLERWQVALNFALRDKTVEMLCHLLSGFSFTLVQLIFQKYLFCFLVKNK